jgi:hypothetical protein
LASEFEQVFDGSAEIDYADSWIFELLPYSPHGSIWNLTLTITQFNIASVKIPPFLSFTAIQVLANGE